MHRPKLEVAMTLAEYGAQVPTTTPTIYLSN